jgi:phosphohistidine phosphatase
MNVYLVQHAEAKSKEEDPDRPLTKRGRRDVEAVAAVAARLGFQVDQIRHSGKARARQTAEVLGAALAPPHGVVAVSGLEPDGDVVPVAQALAAASEPVMLVGHLPFMERLAAQLLTGDPECTVVEFKKGGLVNLAREDDAWRVQWIVTPAVAGA